MILQRSQSLKNCISRSFAGNDPRRAPRQLRLAKQLPVVPGDDSSWYLSSSVFQHQGQRFAGNCHRGALSAYRSTGAPEPQGDVQHPKIAAQQVATFDEESRRNLQRSGKIDEAGNHDSVRKGGRYEQKLFKRRRSGNAQCHRKFL